MKKKLLVLIVILLIAGAGIALLAISNASSLIAQYKPQLESIASDTLGTPVKIGSISTSIFPETKLVIDELSLGDATKGESLSLTNVALRVSLMPLLQKKLVIEELILVKPAIKIIKNASGMHIPGVPKKRSDSNGEKKTEATPPAALPIDLALNQFSIQEGSLTFLDETQNKQIDLSNIVLHTKVSLEGSNAVMQGLTLDGTLMKDVSLNIKAEVGSYNLAKGDTDVPNAAVTIGKNTLNISSLRVTKSGEITYSAKGSDLEAKTFVDALKQMQYMPATVTMQGPLSLETTGGLNAQGITNPTLKLNIFDGTISAPFKLTFGEAVGYSTDLAINSIQIEKAMEFIAPGTQSKLYGTVTNFSGSVAGTLGATLLQNSNGSFAFSIKNGGIRGVNIPGRALKAVDQIPFLQGSLFMFVPPQFKPALESENTEYSDLTGNAALRGGQIYLKGVKLLGALYTIEADGTYGFDGSVDLNATLYFNREFSQALIAQAHDLKKLLQSDGTLVFPITIQGKLPAVIIIPNISKLLETAGGKILAEKAGQAIGKALEKKGLGGIGSMLGF